MSSKYEIHKEDGTIKKTDDIRVVVADYLESQGWRVILVAEHGIKKPNPTAFKYEYNMSFLGKKTEDS